MQLQTAGRTIRPRIVNARRSGGSRIRSRVENGSNIAKRPFFTDAELVNLYKSQLLSYLEYRTPAIYHACDSTLAPLNKFQDKFLGELGISPEDALVHFNLAPLSCRRDMAMMGLLHRAALGKGPDHFRQFFKLSAAERHCTRSGSGRHSRQLLDIRNEHFLEIERRSALGLVWVYNRLPDGISRHDTVK